jgi:hypothetical protein
MIRLMAGEQPEDMGGLEFDDQVYCFCRNVSYGEMIACDGDDCIHEWFHLDCVGLSEPPTGVWYCPDCRKRKKRHFEDD